MLRKTNKTAHVLNSVADGDIPEKKEAPADTSSDKNVIVVEEAGRNDEIASQILDRLTDQLEGSLQTGQGSYHMVNVMEKLLYRMDLPYYMRRYDVCMCSRCQADVRALILTRLPAKYVVMDESSAAPVIGYYESRFRVRVLTEIVKACLDVKSNPRHESSIPYDG